MAAILWESAVTLTRTDDRFQFAIGLSAEAPGTAGPAWRVEWDVNVALAEVGSMTAWSRSGTSVASNTSTSILVNGP